MSSRDPDSALASIMRLLTSQAGLSFRPDETERVAGRIRSAMDRRGISDLSRYRSLVEHDQAARHELIEQLTVSETYFFREPGQFDFIADTVIPDLRKRCRAEHDFRIWCAGCATGEESYSLAIVFHQQNLAHRSNILATDVSQAALDHAKRATFGDWSLRGKGANRVKPFLSPKSGTLVLDNHIRQMVNFQRLNLASESFPSLASGVHDVDLIMCRNVLIYFDAATVEQIAKRFYDSLADGGWLITASSDPHLDRFAPLEPVIHDTGVYYRRPLRDDSGGEDSNVGQRASITRGETLTSNTKAPDIAIDRQQLAMESLREQTESLKDQVDETNDRLIRTRHHDQVGTTTDLLSDEQANVVQVQALANNDTSRAEDVCRTAIEQHPLSAHLHYLHAVLLTEQDRHEAAVEAARRVIYLDRTAAAAHMLLGTCLRQLGDSAGALRAFRNVLELCKSRDPDAPIRFSDGDTTSRLARAAVRQIDAIESDQGAPE